MHEPITCSVCSSERQLSRGRTLVKGYELREYVCPKCGSTLNLVVRIDRAD
jgi:hypothetical protein